jgi:predicted component of type VI protein secretion system
MTEKKLYEEFLRQLPPNGVANPQVQRCYLLSTTKEVVIGRDPNCEIVLSGLYAMVSRRHAVVRPSHSAASSYNCWLLCDLNSANGTYINGQRLQGCQQLLLGDRMTLGHGGAEFVFERHIKHQSTQLASRVVLDAAIIPTPLHSEHSVSFSPVISDSVNRTGLKPQSLPNTRHPHSSICGIDVCYCRSA